LKKLKSSLFWARNFESFALSSTLFFLLILVQF